VDNKSILSSPFSANCLKFLAREKDLNIVTIEFVIKALNQN